MTLPALPPQGSTSWYDHYSALDAQVRSGTTVTSTGITDSTMVGRSLLTASDAAAARTSIGAGTSSLDLGTTASTAAAGNHTHTATGISDSTTTGRALLKATDAAAARSAISAPLGTGITEIRALTQAAYDAIGTKSSTTLYVING